ncbi:MAG: hypothetical protein UH625_02870, partial [Muribaculaceae bacterium]|nr:hypothetical protein [Muribaculaceae bacterium]
AAVEGEGLILNAQRLDRKRIDLTETALHQQLAMMDGHELPLAIGIIRDVEAPTYNDEIDQQVETVRAKKGFDSLRDMILAGETWEVK